MFSIAEVVSIDDYNGGGRIKARVLPVDKFRSKDKIPYAFPLMPKMLHVKPKVGEAVIVLSNDNLVNAQRFYIGPIISQEQYLYKDNFFAGATTLLKGGLKKPDVAVENQKVALGTIAKDDDIAIYGRRNCDMILSDNDIRIRCGARLTDPDAEDKLVFNKNAPAFIKLKYYPEPLRMEATTYGDKQYEHLDTNSVVTIVGDKINLISPNGNPYVDVTDIEEGISDKQMKTILKNCHKLPYGDILVDYLYSFYQMFKSHTHKYDNMKPCPDKNSNAFDAKFQMGSPKLLGDILLSKDIRIN